MIEPLVAALVRMLQGLVMAAPTLLVGLFIAGVIRYYLGPADTRRMFGGDSWRSLPQSWLVGMLLPVCSIGVLPILGQLYRARVRPGAMTAFALTAPLFNPLSLLYGLTLSRPVVIVSFALASLVLVTLLGAIWDRLARQGGSGVDDQAALDVLDRGASGEPVRIIGLHRMLALLVFTARELVGPTGRLVVVAISGLGLLGAVLPYSALQSSFEMHDPWAPARMTLLAIPVYSTPMMTMSQLGMMFVHSNSPGAALALLLLGTGVNFATLLWFVRHYGRRAISIWFVSLVLIVLAAAYAVDRPLILPGAQPAGHTHAFDSYATPFSPGTSLRWPEISTTALRPLELFALVGFALVGLLAAIGLLLRQLSIDERRFQTAAGAKLASYDRIVPAPVLGGTLLIGLIALSVVGCYAYYPPPEECFEEIAIVRSEAFVAARLGHVDEALHWIEQLEDWSRLLEVGTFLRRWEIRPYQRVQGQLLRKKLELLEHELERESIDQHAVEQLLNELRLTDQRWRDSYR